MTSIYLRLATVLIIIISTTKLSAQSSLDSLLTKKLPECPDIANASSVLFTRFIQENKWDSAEATLNYWKNKCGINEPIQRAVFMLGLAKGESVDTLTNDNIISFLYKYKYRQEVIKELNYSSYYSNQAYFSFVPVGQEFDKESTAFFKDQLQKHQQGTSEYLVTRIYSADSDSIFRFLKDPQYQQSKLYRQNVETRQVLYSRPNINLAFLTGVWIPTGELAKLGVHPEIGFQMGAKKKKMSYDISLAFKFLNSAQPYAARRVHANNVVETTSHFFGGYFGIDVGRDILVKNKNEVQLLGGFGFDGWDAFTKDQGTNLRPETVSSYNFNFGLGYRRYFKGSTYLGLRGKYNLVNYKLNNVIDFSGNPISITLVLGALGPQGY